MCYSRRIHISIVGVFHIVHPVNCIRLLLRMGGVDSRSPYGDYQPSWDFLNPLLLYHTQKQKSIGFCRNFLKKLSSRRIYSKSFTINVHIAQYIIDYYVHNLVISRQCFACEIKISTVFRLNVNNILSVLIDKKVILFFKRKQRDTIVINGSTRLYKRFCA